MLQFPEGEQITRTWAFGFAAACFLISLVASLTFAHGHGKAVFFALCVTGFVTKTFQGYLKQPKAVAFLVGVAAVHLLIAFVFPTDSTYTGVILAPVGVADIAILYLLFGRLVGMKPQRG